MVFTGAVRMELYVSLRHLSPLLNGRLATSKVSLTPLSVSVSQHFARKSLQTPFSIRLYSHTSRRCKELSPKEIEEWKKDMAKLENQHLHLRESETEENDAYKLGSMLTRPSMNEQKHTHSHSHAPTPESLSFMQKLLSKSEIKKNAAVRITWIGLLVNVGLALGKFAGGIAFHSQALIADSVHALSDLVSDFLTLFSVKLAKKPANQEYPFGYGKVETVGALAVSSILTFAGVSIGFSSLALICGPYLPVALLEMLHIHNHAEAIGASLGAAWIAGGSILVKEWLFHATKKIAEKENSNVLLANAWHHRVDSLTSLVALVTISGGYVFGITSLDAIGGLLVSGLVIKAGFSGMKSSCQELIDKSVTQTDPRYITVETVIKESLEKLISNNNSKNPYSLNNLTVLAAGPNLQSYIILQVPLQRWDNVLGINEFEIVTDHLRSILFKNVPNMKEIYIEYVEEKPELSDEEKQKIEKQKQLGSAPVPESAVKCTDPSHTHGHSHHHHHH